MKYSFFLIALVITSFGKGFCQIQNSEYKGSLMSFDLSFNNPNSNSLHVIEVGIKNKFITGDFKCISASDVLTPAADFIIQYWVNDNNEIIIKADPILIIEPKKSVRFTISLVPNATGSCGYWATEVSAIVIFDDGTKFYSKPYTITSSDYSEYKMRQPTDNEILQALKNRNPEARRTALIKLVASKLPLKSKEIILKDKLEDENDEVRIVALQAIKKLNLISLGETVISILQNTKDGYEAEQACKTLGVIGNEKAIEPLLYKYMDTINFSYESSYAMEALKTMGHPATPIYLNKILESKFGWADNKMAYKLNSVYDGYCELAIYFQDKTSIPIIRKVLSSGSRDNASLLVYLRDLQKPEERVRNTFVLSFQPEYLIQFKSGIISNRNWALELICMIDAKRENTINIIAQGLKDDAEWVRSTAAKWAGIYGLK